MNRFDGQFPSENLQPPAHFNFAPTDPYSIIEEFRDKMKTTDEIIQEQIIEVIGNFRWTLGFLDMYSGHAFTESRPDLRITVKEILSKGTEIESRINQYNLGYYRDIIDRASDYTANAANNIYEFEKAVNLLYGLI